MKSAIVVSTMLLALLGFMPLVLSSTAWPQGESGLGFLKTKVDPGRAGVFVDGKYVGPAANFGISRKYALPAGEHDIKLAEPRYEEATTKVTIRTGETTTLSEKLRPLAPAKPPFGRLRTVNFDKFAAVYVNDRFYGHADEFSNFAQGILLNPGEYSVKVASQTGSSSYDQKVNIEADKVTIVKPN